MAFATMSVLELATRVSAGLWLHGGLKPVTTQASREMRSRRIMWARSDAS